MSVSKEKKQEIIEKFRVNKYDTGSSEVQIAVLTERISAITAHLKENKKDFSTRRGLIVLVSKRRKLLFYLKSYNFEKYEEILTKLNLKGVK